MKRWLGIGAAAAIVAVALVVAGVGGSGSHTVPSSTVASAAAATTRTGFRLALEARTGIPGSARSVPFSGSGAIDPVHRRGVVDVDLSNLPGMALAGGDARLHEVLDGLVVYMRAPFFKGLPGGKSWVRFDLGRIRQQFGLDSSDGGITSDPSRLLDQLRATSGRVQSVGRERVRGAPTTHYRATVDLRRYPSLVPRAERAVARRGIARLIALTGSSRFPEDVWIDARSRVRRFRVAWTLRPPLPSGARRVNFEMTEELYDFGTPVHVKPPPRSEAVDVTRLARQRIAGLVR